MLIRRAILFILGLSFNAPALALIVGVLVEDDYSNDDAWAMLFMGTLLAIIGILYIIYIENLILKLRH